MGTKIKLFTDWLYRPSTESSPAFILYPLWQIHFGSKVDCRDKSEFRDVNRFGSLISNWNKYFEYVSKPESADYVILPSDWKHYLWAGKQDIGLKFLKKTELSLKRTIVQYNADDDLPLAFPGVCMLPIVVRTSLNVSQRQPNEYVMPGFVGDPLAVYSKDGPSLRQKITIPKVSYCGWASAISMDEQELESFHLLVESNQFSNLSLLSQADKIYSFRRKVLDLLQQSPRIETDVIIREGYCAGIDRAGDNAGLALVRQEYFANLLGSDYVLCIRGKGNYSYRFYETLAASRIPIFINTDSPLPLPETINWRDHCVLIEHRDIKSIDKTVLSYHDGLSADEFANIQRGNRLLWENLLTPERYFAHLFTHLSSMAMT